jgi:hypothetical protein
MSRLLPVVAILFASVAVRADDKPQPAKPMPINAQLSLKDGKLVIEQQVPVTVEREIAVVKEVLVNGQVQKVVTKEKVLETRIELRTISSEGMEVQDAAGKKIDNDKLAEMLKKSVQAMMMPDGSPLDPALLKNAKEGFMMVVKVKKDAPK